MSSMSNFITNLADQFGPALVMGLLLAVVACLGILLGASCAAIIGSVRRRRWLEDTQEDQRTLQKLLADARVQSARVQAAQATAEVELEMQQTQATEALAMHDALVSRTQLQDDRIVQLQSELEAAESLSRARQRELLSRRDQREDDALPTLIKRVYSSNNVAPCVVDTGIIPDDQVIPDLPEAELTANVDAYDLSDLEELVVSKG